MKRRPRRPKFGCVSAVHWQEEINGAHAWRVTVAQDLDGAPVLEGNNPGSLQLPIGEDTRDGSSLQ